MCRAKRDAHSQMVCSRQITSGLSSYKFPCLGKKLLQLLFRHSAKSQTAQEERLKIRLPNAIEVRLHVRKTNVAILTSDTAGSVGV